MEIELDAGTGYASWLTIWGGGTLVFDVDGALLHHAEKPVTRDRVRQVKSFVGSQLAARAVGIRTDSLDDAIRAEFTGRPWSLKVSGDQVTLSTNPAARCRCGVARGGAR